MDNDLITKWLEGTLTEEEKATFERSGDYKSLTKLSGSIPAFKAPEYDVQAGLARLQAEKASRGKVVSISWTTTLLKVAAALTVLLTCYYFFVYNRSNTLIETQAGVKTEILLPDSSEVVVNALSALSYQKQMKERVVELNGEAFFKVKKGSRFDVITSKGTVRVLGTQFNVKNRGEYFEVICYEGLVRVESNGKTRELRPHQIFRSIKDVVIDGVHITDTSPGWINNESSFQSVPFSEVVKELEIQFNVSVTTNQVDLNQLFTGKFSHTDLSLALKSVTLPVNLAYQIKDKRNIVLSGELE
jgi:transmembrane sensor